MARADRFRFRKYDSIGYPAAESDSIYLSKCFVDTGALENIRSCTDQRAIVLGRTGAGKTALLTALADREERVVALNPADIALSYLSSSSVLKFLDSLAVDFDPYFRFLWRHVLVVELLKRRFDLRSEEQKAGMWDDLRFTLLKKQSHKDAFEYLNTWGTNFVSSTAERITESTRKLESDVRTSLGVNAAEMVKLGAEGGARLTEEQKSEFRQHGEDVVNSIQDNKLTLVANALDEEILTDARKRYFITIDSLDEDWVDDPRRYRLIRALIETIRDLNNKVQSAKIVIALRVDLFDRVLRATTGAGFQDEKYRGLCLPVTWGREQLETVLDARVNELVQSRYTSQLVTHKDLMSTYMGGSKSRQKTLSFILDRTLLRPRDVIAYLNVCISNAEGDPMIRAQAVLAAEAEYSQGRLNSLKDEWSVQYPYLLQYCNVLRKRAPNFRLSDIGYDELVGLCIAILDRVDAKATGEDVSAAKAFYESQASSLRFRASVIQVLYRVGIVGIKPAFHDKTMWSYDGGRSKMPVDDIEEDTTVCVHPMLHSALGISSRLPPNLVARDFSRRYSSWEPTRSLMRLEQRES